MNDNNRSKYRPATNAIRAGFERTNQQEHSEAIFTTSSFVFDSAKQAADRFSNAEPGNVYSRFTNPTVQQFERRLAAMEGGESCVATASGMAAIMTMCLGLLQAGDHVVCSSGLFGTSKLLFTNILSRFGVEFDFVDLNDLAAWQENVRENTKFVYFETPTNPLTEIVDIRQISDLVKSINSETLVVVDNCFCTPALQQPLKHGADIIIHSATKYLDGQGRCVGGAIVGDKYWVGEKIYGVLRTAGPSMSPFNAWVFLKGLETLSLRMEKSSNNAQILAEYLLKHPQVDNVYFPGLPDHPQHDLIGRQQSMPGGIVSFEVKGGQQAAWDLIDRTELYSITANLGDTRSTITHPATTTHGRWTPEERQKAGILDSLVRISVGLEDVVDLIEDLRF
ncbi:MAG: O-succinylhomoserine sulfhydrylase [Arenicella sp.]